MSTSAALFDSVCGPAARPPMLVCFAVKEEAAKFLPLIAQRRDVRVLFTGMGRANARRAIRAELAKLTVPSLVLSSGFAGGLSPKLAPGTVVFDTDAGPKLSDALHAAGAWPAAFHTAEKVAATSVEKRVLRHATQAEAVDMESEEIRSACRERGVPSATVRAISDTVDEDLPLDFNALMNEEMEIDRLKLSWAVLKSPGKIGELMRFKKRVEESSQRLAEVLFRIINL